MFGMFLFFTYFWSSGGKLIILMEMETIIEAISLRGNFDGEAGGATSFFEISE